MAQINQALAGKYLTGREQQGQGFYQVKMDKNGNVGVDYFDSIGRPINREQFERLGGDPQYVENGIAGEISQNIAEAREYGRASDMGYSPGADRSTMNPAQINYMATGANNPTPTTTTSTSTISEPTSDIKVFNGQEYDVATTEGLNNYINAVNQSALDSYNKEIKQIDSLYSNGLIDVQKREEYVTLAKNRIKTQREDLLEDYEYNKEGMGNQLTDTLGSQTAFFNKVAPDAYMSQQSNFADRSRGEYDRGLGRMDTLRGRNERSLNETETQLGSGDFANTLPTDTSATGDVVRARQSLDTWKPDAVAQADQRKQANIDAARQYQIDSISAQNQVAPERSFANVAAPTTERYNVADFVNNLIGQKIYGYGQGGQTTPFSIRDKSVEDDNWWA
jgi:hypothetical protein